MRRRVWMFYKWCVRETMPGGGAGGAEGAAPGGGKRGGGGGAPPPLGSITSIIRTRRANSSRNAENRSRSGSISVEKRRRRYDVGDTSISISRATRGRPLSPSVLGSFFCSVCFDREPKSTLVEGLSASRRRRR